MEKRCSHIVHAVEYDLDATPYTGRSNVKFRGLPRTPRTLKLLDLAYVHSNNNIVKKRGKANDGKHDFIWARFEEIVQGVFCDIQ